MIVSFTNYYDQSQIIGIGTILDYHGAIPYAGIITGQAYVVVGRVKDFTVTGRTKDFKLE